MNHISGSMDLFDEAFLNLCAQMHDLHEQLDHWKWQATYWKQRFGNKDNRRRYAAKSKKNHLTSDIP